MTVVEKWSLLPLPLYFCSTCYSYVQRLPHTGVAVTQEVSRTVQPQSITATAPAAMGRLWVLLQLLAQLLLQQPNRRPPSLLIQMSLPHLERSTSQLVRNVSSIRFNHHIPSKYKEHMRMSFRFVPSPKVACQAQVR